ncbi:MAG: Gfo/Idh/MocA family oxidoreductase [Spirochaetes bacterium]|nr:Gfo/Idh/MocA family oxidoreductase [Spirochaetota bacterium]
MIGIGIIGAGGIAQAHAEAVRSLADRARLVAIAETDPARARTFAEKHGVGKIAADRRDLLADPAIRMVCICTPNATHASFCVEALEAGKAVLCEKPIAGSLAELDLIADACRRTGGIVSSIFNWRYGGGYRAMRELVAGGAAGRVLWAQVNVLWRRTAEYYRSAGGWRGTWKGERGGPLITLGIHAIDAAFSLLAAPCEVHAVVDRFTHDVEVEDTSAAVLRLADGGMASVNVTSASHDESSQVQFVCERLTASSNREPYAAAEWPWFFHSDDPRTRDLIDAIAVRSRPEREENAHLAQIRDFLDHLERGENGPVPLGEARRSLEVIAGIYKAGFTGQPAALPLSPDDPFYREMNGGRILEGRRGRR